MVQVTVLEKFYHTLMLFSISFQKITLKKRDKIHSLSVLYMKGLSRRRSKMNEQELTRLVEKFSRTVYGVAYCYLHNSADADDIMQDTFLALYTLVILISISSAYYRLMHECAENGLETAFNL